MAGSSVASPLCTWLVAACMSTTCDREHSVNPAAFPTAKRLSSWARRRRILSKCTVGGSEISRGLISSLCGSSIQGLMSSCLALEPCQQYNSSFKGLSSFAIFGDNAFSLFGSKTLPVHRSRSPTGRQRRLNRATCSGTCRYSPGFCFLLLALAFQYCFSFVFRFISVNLLLSFFH